MTSPVHIKPVYSIQEFCKEFGVGRTIAYEEIKEGRLPSFTARGRRKIAGEDALAWRDSYRTAPTGAGGSGVPVDSPGARCDTGAVPESDRMTALTTFGPLATKTVGRDPDTGELAILRERYAKAPVHRGGRRRKGA